MFARLFPLLLSGCATSWIITEAAGGQRVLDEGVHDVHVPQPGIEEHLAVTLPLSPTTVPASQPGQPPTVTPITMTCTSAQSGHDVVYHQAFRYGSGWKKATAISFAIEAALGAVFLLTADEKSSENYAYGGFFAVDAAITAPLFFIPRKEIYRNDDVVVTTPLRTDCPDGLALEINGDSFPIDATGKLGDVAEAALAQYLKAPSGSLRVVLAGQARDLACGPQNCVATVPVPVGTLSTATADLRPAP